MITVWNNQQGIHNTHVGSLYSRSYVEVSSEEFTGYESLSLTMQISAVAGDKVKAQMRVILGSNAETATDSVRFRIRKLIE